MKNNADDIKLFENTALVGVLLGVLTLLVSVGYVLITMPVQETKITRKLAEKRELYLPGARPQSVVELHIPVESASFFVGDRVSVPIEVASGGVDLAGLDMGISYPVDLLDFVEIEKGQAFDQLLHDVNFDRGEVYISGLSSPESFFNGREILATIVFEARESGECKLSFLERRDGSVASVDPEAGFVTVLSDFTFEVKEATEAVQGSQ